YRAPHARPAAALAQRLARLLVHTDGVVGVLENRGVADAREAIEDRPNDLLIAKQAIADVRTPGKGDVGAGQHLHRPEIAAHHIERGGDSIRHRAPSFRPRSPPPARASAPWRTGEHTIFAS